MEKERSGPDKCVHKEARSGLGDLDDKEAEQAVR
jgi:hypothetical protein